MIGPNFPTPPPPLDTPAVIGPNFSGPSANHKFSLAPSAPFRPKIFFGAFEGTLALQAKFPPVSAVVPFSHFSSPCWGPERAGVMHHFRGPPRRQGLGSLGWRRERCLG